MYLALAVSLATGLASCDKETITESTVETEMDTLVPVLETTTIEIYHVNVGSQIEEDLAVEMIHRYMDVTNSEYESLFTGSNTISMLINEPNVVGVSFVPAMNADSSITLVMVGTDANGDDITPPIDVFIGLSDLGNDADNKKKVGKEEEGGSSGLDGAIVGGAIGSTP